MKDTTGDSPNRKNVVRTFPAELLLCPNCRGELIFSGVNCHYMCLSCKSKFPIVNGIIHLLPRDLEISKLSEEKGWLEHEVIDKPTWYALSFYSGYLRYLTEQILPKYFFKGRVLELGAGVCLASHLIKQNYPSVEVIASDLVQTILKKGREVGKMLNSTADWYVLADSEKLPFKDGTFDFIFGARVLHHLPDPKKGVSEIYRVLKDKGMYIVALEPLIGGAWKPLWNRVFIGRGGKKLGIIENIYTYRQWIRFFSLGGFQIVSVNIDREWRYQEHHWLTPLYFKLISYIPEPLVKNLLTSRITISSVKS